MKKLFILLFVANVMFGTAFSIEVYVRFKSNTTLPNLQKGQKKMSSKALPLSSKIIRKYSIADKARSMSFMSNDILKRTFKISISDSIDADAFIEEILLQENVELVEKVPINYTFAVPNDSFYGTVGGYDLNWHLDMINAEKAWDSAQGNPNIIVAVVDNAVWGEHEDLNIPGNLQYNMVADSVGKSYPSGVSPGTSTARSLSHGTHCAGSIGAINNNGTGIASLSSGITLMGCGGWSFNNLDAVVGGYDGIEWAAEHGARVISCSWGSSDYNFTEAEIIRQCYEKGILVVGAAGNDGKNEVHYPGGYKGAISVGSVDSDHRLSDFSNYGAWVSIAAPGGTNGNFSIFSTVSYYSTLTYSQASPFYHKFYDRMQGTSMACPIVSALAGLMLSKDSSLTPDQIITLMQTTAQDKRKLNINPYSGVIDASTAINAVCAKTKCGNAVRNLSASLIYLDSVKIEWKVPIDTYMIKGYAVYCDNILLDSMCTDTVFYDRNLVAGAISNVIKEYMVYPVYNDSKVLPSRAYTNIDIPRFYKLTLSATKGGSVSAITAGYPNYRYNVLVRCEAKPDSGYSFVEWSDTVNYLYSSNSNYSFRMNNSINLKAKFQLGTSVEENNIFENALKVYPNPASDYIIVSSAGSGFASGVAFGIVEVFEVFDLNGRKVLSGTFSGERIDVSSLKAGVYVLQIAGAGGGASAGIGSGFGSVKTVKFVKK